MDNDIIVNVVAEAAYQLEKSYEVHSSETTVALFGGSFDPVTHGHLLMASNLIYSGTVSQVWFVPCGPREDKDLRCTVLQRCVMCHLAIRETFPKGFPVKVCTEELREPKALST
jgi:nicotinic acid mononucleotide adenylyltransferase